MRDDRHGSPGDAAAWSICFDSYAPHDEQRREVILALGNGVFVTRAALPESRQDGLHYPGTYHAGCYDRVPNEIAGERDLTESLVNLPNWLPLAMRVEGGEWWRLDQLDILDYAHRLDMRHGHSRRELVAEDRDGRRFRLCEERLVSIAEPQLCALRLRVEALNWSGTVEIRSVLEAGVVNANVRRFEDYEKRHLNPVEAATPAADLALLRVRTSDGRTTLSWAQRTAAWPSPVQTRAENSGAGTGHLLRVPAEPGRPVVVEKVAALCSTLDPSCSDPASAATAAARQAPAFDTLLQRHADAWSGLWRQVALDAEQEDVLRALRFHAFHILQTVSPHSAALDTGIPARGWHGEAYHGHIFWDELFVLPFLHFRFPEISRASLMYRHRRLDAARAAAKAAGYRGAMYPWRSASDGREVTPRHQKNLLNGEWMHDHTYLQRHIGASIAFNIWEYWLVSGDDDFMQRCGAEMMLEIARFWGSIARPDDAGERYRIDGVIGPDEYHTAYPWRGKPGLDNNAYTNLMAVWTLCRARELLERLPPGIRSALRDRLALDDAELALWDRISRRMTVCFHGDGVISQFEHFERLQEFDAAMLPAELAEERTDWALCAIGREPNEFQVSKQADVLVLFYLLGEDEVIGLLRRLGYGFDHAAALRTARYYLPRTMHRSSLSRVVYCGALARLDPELSWDFWLHALETDLSPLKGESVQEGVHLGAMGSTLDILQRRYLGIVATPDGLVLKPALPPKLGRVRLGLRYRGQRLEVEACDGMLQVGAHPGNAAGVPLLAGQEPILLRPGEQRAIRSGS